MQNSGGVISQVMKQYALRKSWRPTFASRKKIRHGESLTRKTGDLKCHLGHRKTPQRRRWVVKKSAGVFLQVMTQDALRESHGPTFAPRK